MNDTQLIKYIFNTTKKFRKLLLIMLLCILIISIDANIKPYIIKLIIDQSNNFDSRNFYFLSIIFILSQLTMVLANTLFDWLGTKFHTKYRSYTVHNFFDQITKFHYPFFQNNQIGSITARITDAFNFIPILIFMTMKTFVNFILFVSIAFFILSKISYFFVIANIIWMIIFIVLTTTFYIKYKPMNADYATVRPKIYGFLSDYFSNILSVWFFNGQKSEKNNLHKLTDQFIYKSTKCGKYLRNYYATHGIIVTLYMAIIMISLGYLFINNKITSGDFALIFIINYKIIDLLFEVSGLSVEFITNYGVAENAIKILDNIKKDDENNHDKNITIKSPPFIEFHKVCFSYGKNNTVFNNLSIKIKAKEKVGIVGYSGSGKTTFVNLILRLYKVDSGKICINEHNINDIPNELFYDQISLVPQENNLFHRTIIDNISYGTENKDDIIKVAKKSNIHEFIEKLPEKYETIVGEKGVKLSGGQKQRISFARAVMKNAPIFILDEATSHLDSITENNIKDNINELLKDKTALVVAHRLSTLDQMDRIIVFDKGKIVEDGTKIELLKKDGVFKKLYIAQKNGILPI